MDMTETQLYPFIEYTLPLGIVYPMAGEQITDLAAFGIHLADGVTKFVFVGGKSTAFEHSDL